MYNITLISTRHEKIGECNSNELCQIIEGIGPEVIFEEIPPSFFDKYYIEKSRGNLETEAISIYLATNNAELVPVDSDNIPSETFFRDHKYALERVEGLADINGFNYRSLVDRNRHCVAMHGFKYLNSNYCTAYNDEICDAVEKGLGKINNDKLFQAYRLWNEVNERRENEMLHNIYHYSKEHCYNRAVFLLGAGHRKSIMKKIKNCEKNGVQRLNWLFYND
jgi:hypothetical protein